MPPETNPSPDAVPSRFQVDFTGRTLLGIYLVEGKLAEGGMGAVYLAKDTNLGRRVVVKVPHTRFLGEPGFRSRFHREISELVRLEHPHIVRILARGEENEIPFFVLQFLGGGSLEDRIRSRTPITPSAGEWLPAIAATLDHVHAQGVVHRDVKPANILFDESGHVFLSDFGVVKALKGDESGELTEVGTGVGSPFYMAPEQAIGGPVTAASDQYALASTLYEALCGVPPFGRGSLIEVMLRKQQSDPAPLSGLGAGLPERSKAALARAMSRTPAPRFSTCSAFADEFARGFAPPPAAEGSAAGVSGSVRTRWAALAAVVVVLAGLTTHWFGLESASSTSASIVSSSPIRPADEIFVLAGKGAEPRRTYRMRPVVGANERLTSRIRQVMKQSITDSPGFEGVFASDQPLEAHVESVEPSGRVHVAWVIGIAQATVEVASRPELAAGEQKIYDSLGVLHATSVFGPYGGTFDISLDAKRDLSSRASGIVTGYEQSIRTMSIDLPDEPIGVGAIWDVTRAASMIGIRFQESVSYEAVRVDENGLVLKFHGSQSALPQGYAPPGLPAGTTVAIKTFQTSIEGEIEIDVSRIVPTRFESKGTVVLESSVAGPDAPKDGALRFECSFESRIKRD